MTSAVHVSSPNLETLLDNFTQAASLFISLEGGQRWRKVDAWKSFRRGTEKWSRAFFRTKTDSVFFYPAGIISFFFLSIPARRRSPVAFSVMISFQFLLLSPRFCFFLFSCLVPRETKLTRIFPDIWCDIYIYICARLCGKSFTKSGLEICVKKVRGKEMEIIKDKYLCVPLFYEKIGG